MVSNAAEPDPQIYDLQQKLPIQYHAQIEPWPLNLVPFVLLRALDRPKPRCSQGRVSGLYRKPRVPTLRLRDTSRTIPVLSK